MEKDEPKGKKKRDKVIAAALAILAGVTNALFGGGGGMLIVPALTRFSGVEEKRAHATSVAVMLPLSFLAAVILTIRGVWDLRIGLSVGAGAIVGGVVGAIALKKVPKEWLSLFFYGAMIYAGVKFLR